MHDKVDKCKTIKNSVAYMIFARIEKDILKMSKDDKSCKSQ